MPQALRADAEPWEKKRNKTVNKEAAKEEISFI